MEKKLSSKELNEQIIERFYAQVLINFGYGKPAGKNERKSK
jgi:hypothetical protein